MKSLIELAQEELAKHPELNEARTYSSPGYSTRHYEEFATLLAGIPKDAKHEDVVHHIASHFAKDNPKFQTERFKKAVEDRKPKGSAQ